MRRELPQQPGAQLDVAVEHDRTQCAQADSLAATVGMPQHDAQGTSLAILLPPVGFLSVLQYWRAGHVNVAVALWAAAGFLVGGWLGGTIAQRIADRALRRLFALLLLAVAVDLFRR